jgi:hypothetical protein
VRIILFAYYLLILSVLFSLFTGYRKVTMPLSSKLGVAAQVARRGAGLEEKLHDIYPKDPVSCTSISVRITH